MTTLQQMLKAPQLFQEVSDAVRKRLLGTVAAAERADAVRVLSEWEGVSADAAHEVGKRTVKVFGDSQASDLNLIRRADAAVESATKNAQDVRAMLEKADAYPAIEVNLDTNEVMQPDVTGMNKGALDRIWRKYQDLKDEVKRLVGAGDETESQFASGVQDGAIVDPSSAFKNYPIPDGLKLPPPDGKSENMGHWVFKQYREGDPETVPATAGFKEYAPGMVPGFDKPPTVGTHWFVKDQSWTEDQSAAVSYVEQRYEIRLAGQDYTNIQQVVTDSQDRTFTGQWVDNSYEGRWSSRSVSANVPSLDQSQVGSWQPISHAGISDISKEFPKETFRYPIAQPWRFPEYNGMPSGGVVEIVNGQQKKVY
ncbi:hypothetical protein ACWWSA_01235 [Mycobacteroides abscessus subsp. abscessus]